MHMIAAGVEIIMNKSDQYSIVIPAFNEEENIPLLAQELESVLNELSITWECIWVDDHSNDGTWEQISLLRKPHIGLRLSRNCGQSTALMAGIDSSSYENIITLDSDLQNNPMDIPALISAYSSDVNVVCGYRVKRKDGWLLRKIPSLVANYFARKVAPINVRDLGCTLRLFEKELILQNRLMGEMHRVLVIHFASAGATIVEVPVSHRARVYGKSKYGLSRTFKFLADLILARVMKVLKTKPLYFFGSISLAVSLVGGLIFLSAIIMRLSHIKSYLDTSLIVGSIILFSTSLVLLSIGMVAEILLRNLVHSDRTFQYNISKSHNSDQ
jgi:glycosyltransferase involved in cell wall biosynthesis